MMTENKANYTVTTMNGKVYRWRFIEHKIKSDYGNGIYIGVTASSGELSSLDCRYIKGYDFRKTCVDYLLRYYGANLDELSEDE